MSDTIYALSSGRPPAAIAVIRVSGPRAGNSLKALTGKLPAPREAALARVRDPQNGETIDQAVALFFPGPNSETGEDVAEFQLHGGRAVIAATLAALSRMDGLRLAEPGEFTRRAFENGKLDLTAVEGLADLIYADTEAQRRQAVRQLSGLLGKRAEGWRTRLVEGLALAEAGIDFSDEADVASDVSARAVKIARELASEISATLADARRGERLREGLVVAIAGPPNAGKSTLLNRLARREAAIVSPLPGTTRDVIEVHLDLEGYPVTLLDTAGIRETSDPVEREGVRRARARAADADVVIWVAESAAQEQEGEKSLAVETKPAPEDRGLSGKGDAGSRHPHVIIVRNKIDLQREGKGAAAPGRDALSLSAATGEGVAALLAALAREAAEMFGQREPALVTRERQRLRLEEAVGALQRAVEHGRSEDLLAEDLRLAARALGRLSRRVDVEDILDVIFRDFCIGK